MCSFITAIVLCFGTLLPRYIKKKKSVSRKMRCPLRGPEEIKEWH